MLVCSSEPCVCWFVVLSLVCADFSAESCVCWFVVLSLVCVGLQY